MADFVFNVAKGHVSEYASRILANDPANSAFVVVLLKASVADATAKDYDDLSAVLGDAGTTEAVFTSYVRKTLDDVGDGLTRTIDDTNDRIDIDVSDIVWSPAGNGANDTLTDLLFTYDSNTTAGTDANIVPCTQHDFEVTTDGSDLTAQVANFFRAS
jgi:hypothetical protein